MIMGDCDFSRFLMEMGGDIGTVRLHCDEETTTKCDSDCAKSVQRIYNHPCMQVCTSNSLITFNNVPFIPLNHILIITNS